VTAAAPVIGQDNEIVFREYLGLTEEEYRKLEENGVI
jgi:crotonobetainyl-CoA:carnitine CoA-transferase CaiB-like acyl-CoA transferase